MTRKMILAAVLTAFALVGCATLSQRHLRDEKPPPDYTGWWVTWDDSFGDGYVMASKCYYKNGKAEGKYLGWDQQGNLESQGIMRKGLKHGKWTHYAVELMPRERLYKYCETQYDKGQIVFHTVFLSDGSTSYRTGMRNGEPHGLWTQWHGRNRKHFEGSHIDGKRVGRWTFWDYEGRVERIEYYEDNKLVREEDPSKNKDVEPGVGD